MTLRRINHIQQVPFFKWLPRIRVKLKHVWWFFPVRFPHLDGDPLFSECTENSANLAIALHVVVAIQRTQGKAS